MPVHLFAALEDLVLGVVFFFFLREGEGSEGVRGCRERVFGLSIEGLRKKNRSRRRLRFFPHPSRLPPPSSLCAPLLPVPGAEMLSADVLLSSSAENATLRPRKALGAPPSLLMITDRCVRRRGASVVEPRARAASKSKKLTFCANRSAADVLSPVVITAVITGRFLATSEYQWPVATNGLARERASEAMISGVDFGFLLGSRRKKEERLSARLSSALLSSLLPLGQRAECGGACSV